MPNKAQKQMITECVALINAADERHFTNTAPNSDTRHGLPALQYLAALLVPDVITGRLGPTTVAGIAERYMDEILLNCLHPSMRDKPVKNQRAAAQDLVSCLLHQADYVDKGGVYHLNFFAAAITEAQVAQLVRDVGQNVRFYRALPTSPSKHVKMAYRERYQYGFQKDLPTGSFDLLFATVRDRLGNAQSIGLGPIVQATPKDLEPGGLDLKKLARLTPQQQLCRRHATLGLLAQGGAVVQLAMRHLNGQPLVLIPRPRYVGPGSLQWQQNSTQMLSPVDFVGYALVARRCFGDAIVLPIQADGPTSDHGLERKHVYVPAREHPENRVRGGMFEDPRIRAVPNDKVRDAIGSKRFPRYYAIDREDPYIAQSDLGFFAVLMPGEVRNTRPGGETDRGQGLLIISQSGQPRWYVVLNKSDGTPTWTGTRSEIEAQLEEVVDFFDLLEGPGSTAGPTRRDHYTMFENDFNVPLSDPSGRQNVFCLASAARQSGFPPDMFGQPVPVA